MRIVLTVLAISFSFALQAQTTLTFTVGGGASNDPIAQPDTLERLSTLVNYFDSLGYELKTPTPNGIDLYLVSWECSMTVNSTYKTSRIDGVRFPLDFEQMVAKLHNGKKIYAGKVQLMPADGTFSSTSEMVFEKVRWAGQY